MTKIDTKIELSAKKYPLTYVKVPPSPLGGDLWLFSFFLLSNPKWRISVCLFFAVVTCFFMNSEFTDSTAFELKRRSRGKEWA